MKHRIASAYLYMAFNCSLGVSHLTYAAKSVSTNHSPSATKLTKQPKIEELLLLFNLVYGRGINNSMFLIIWYCDKQSCLSQHIPRQMTIQRKAAHGSGCPVRRKDLKDLLWILSSSVKKTKPSAGSNQHEIIWKEALEPLRYILVIFKITQKNKPIAFVKKNYLSIKRFMIGSKMVQNH